MSNNWTVCVDLPAPERISDVTLGHPLEAKLSQLRSDADAHLVTEKKESYDRGYADGLAQGQSELNEKIKEFQSIELQFLKQVSGSVGDFMDQMRPQLVQLAFEVSKHFISENNIDQDFLNEEISKALKELHDHSKIEVHLNEVDFDILSKSSSSVFSAASLNKDQVIFRKSSEVSSGGFTIKGDLGSRDYSRHTKFNFLAQELEVPQ